jgi:hypothetical protein
VKEFKPQWEEQLKSEGCKILLSDFLGRSCFLIRKPQPSNNSMGSNPSMEQTQIEEKPKPNVEEAIIQLIKERKNFKEIRQTLNLTHAQAMGYISGLRKKGVLDELNWVSKRRLKKPSTQEAKPTLNASNLNVREMLEVSLKILDEYPRIAKFLLEKAKELLP